jgi:hypothetical protein
VLQTPPRSREPCARVAGIVRPKCLLSTSREPCARVAVSCVSMSRQRGVRVAVPLFPLESAQRCGAVADTTPAGTTRQRRCDGSASHKNDALVSLPSAAGVRDTTRRGRRVSGVNLWDDPASPCRQYHAPPSLSNAAPITRTHAGVAMSRYPHNNAAGSLRPFPPAEQVPTTRRPGR